MTQGSFLRYHIKGWVDRRRFVQQAPPPRLILVVILKKEWIFRNHSHLKSPTCEVGRIQGKMQL